MLFGPSLKRFLYLVLNQNINANYFTYSLFIMNLKITPNLHFCRKKILFCFGMVSMTVTFGNGQVNEPNPKTNLALSSQATITSNIGTSGEDPKTILFDPQINDYRTKTLHNTYGTGVESFVTVDYLAVVKAYADKMIADVTDRYGAEQSPLFLSAYDRMEDEAYQSPAAGISGIRYDDRSIGGNPMHDEYLYQLLYPLTTVTGDAKYKTAADASLKWFFENCQSPYNGLMAWGEHTYWNPFKEKAESLDDLDNPQTIHEFFRPWVLWEQSYALAPEAVEKFALGLWNHQVVNQETGDFSRHYYHTFSPNGRGQSGYQFPRHGGFYILTWAEVYRKNQNSEMLQAIETLVDFYNNNIDPVTNLIPLSTKSTSRHSSTSCLSLAVDLHTGAQYVPETLQTKMLDLADYIDEAYFSLDHNPEETGFVEDAGTLEGGELVVSNDFSSSYGANTTHAHHAMHCLIRYQQLADDNPYKERYKDLIIQTADYYLGKEVMPVFYTTDIASKLLALELGAYRITGDKKYLEKACRFANIFSSSAFFRNQSPLPQASTSHLQYETITLGDALMAQLLDLWMELYRPDVDSNITWIDR